MFCTKCGAKISDDAQFCPKCGTPVRITTIDQSVEAYDMAITEDTNQNKVKNKSPMAVRTFSAPVMFTTIILSGIGCVFSIATLIAYLQSMRPEVMAIAYICVVAGIAFVSLVCCLMLKKKPIFTVVLVCLLAGIDFLFFKDGIYHIQRPVHLFIFEYCNSNIGESISVAVGIVMPIAAVLYLISIFTKGYARKIFSGIAAVLFCLSLGLFIPLLVKMPSYWSEFIPVQEGYATPDLNTFSAWLAVDMRGADDNRYASIVNEQGEIQYEPKQIAGQSFSDDFASCSHNGYIFTRNMILAPDGTEKHLGDDLTGLANTELLYTGQY